VRPLLPLAILAGFGTDIFGSAIVFQILQPGAESILGWVLGGFMTFLGGMVAAQLAPGSELASAFGVGALTTAYTFLIVLASPAEGPFWPIALAMLITVPLAVAGGTTRAALRMHTS